jgi:hypothetical protein
MYSRKKPVHIPLIFNGFPSNFILKICKVAQDCLLDEEPNGFYPIPFVNGTEFGSNAIFKSKEIANKVEEIMSTVVTEVLSISHKRIIMISFQMAIKEDELNDFIFYIEQNTFFLCHPKEGYAKSIIQKMIEILEKYMIPNPIVLVSDLIEGCTVSLKEDERLMIPCDLQTFLIPISSKEDAFFKEFNGKLERLKKMEVDCKGMLFNIVKSICQGIDVKGVYYFITPNHVELTGLPFHLKNFSEILKRRIRDEQSEVRVLSRK